MIKLKAILLISIAVFTVSCGYKIRGLNLKDPAKFYVTKVINESLDVKQTPLIRSTIERYLVTYSELTNSNTAKYFLTIKVSAIKYNPIITSPTDESIATNAVLAITYIVNDRQDNEIYSRTFNATRSFSVTGIVSDTLINTDEAIRSGIESTAADFRFTFFQVMR